VLWSYTSFLDTITKVDAYTVRIKTTAPFAAMNSTLSSIPIFPKYLWQGIADPVANEPRPYPVGSGAMYYDPNSDLSSHIILHRNPNYYGDAMYCQKSRPDEVRFLLYTASSTLIDDFGSGTSRLDAIFNIPAASFVNAASLNQPTVTKIQVAGGFVGEVSSNVLTDTLRAQYVAAGNTAFEPAVANISIWMRQTEIETPDSLGATVPGYEVKDPNAMGSIWSALDYDIWLWDWVFTRVSDPSIDVLHVHTTPAIGVLRDNGYTNATFDAKYNQSLTTLDPAARRVITDAMQMMVYDYASYILPYYPNDLYAVTSHPTLGSGWQH